MKAETQSLHLAKMMQKHQLFPEYQLSLSPILIKKGCLKKLKKGDILLSGFDTFELMLVNKNSIYANVNLHINSHKISISKIPKTTILTTNSKKYEVAIFSFGKVQSRELSLHHKIDIATLDLTSVTLMVNEKDIAICSLVNVDDEIALKIEKVL